MSEPDQDQLRARVEALEARAAEDRDELARLRRVVAPPLRERRPPASPVDEAAAIRRRRWRSAIDVALFVVGATGTLAVALLEMHLHWALGVLAAPLGGAVVVLLGRAGVTV